MFWGWSLHDDYSTAGGVGIADREPVDDETVVHVLGVQRRAAGQLRGGDDHAVVYVELVPLGEVEAALMGFEGQRDDGARSPVLAANVAATTAS